VVTRLMILVVTRLVLVVTRLVLVVTRLMILVVTGLILVLARLILVVTWLVSVPALVTVTAVFTLVGVLRSLTMLALVTLIAPVVRGSRRIRVGTRLPAGRIRISRRRRSRSHGGRLRRAVDRRRLRGLLCGNGASVRIDRVRALGERGRRGDQRRCQENGRGARGCELMSPDG
jgi:hypothetical protein